jgi:DNA repair exonuclease SbcCD ATPase subunit
MPDAGKKKVSVWVPLELLSKLEDRGYTSQTEAVLKGLERLIVEDNSKTLEDIKEDKDKTDGRYQALQDHIETLKNTIIRLEDDKRRLEDMYNTHVLQVQTLINSRLIESDTKKRWWKFW